MKGLLCLTSFTDQGQSQGKKRSVSNQRFNHVHYWLSDSTIFACCQGIFFKKIIKHIIVCQLTSE